MTISFVDHLSEGFSGTDPTTLNYNSAANGNLLLAFITGKPSSRTIAVIPAPFSGTEGNTTGGAGPGGSDTGLTRIYCMYRTVDGSEPASSSVDWSSSPTTIQSMAEFSKSNVGAWSVAFVFGSDSTQLTGTDAIDVTATADPGFTSGDKIVVAFSSPSSAAANFINPEIIIPGCTVSAPVTLYNFSTSVGNHSRLVVWEANITAGTSTGNPQFRCDVDELNNSAGPATFVRLREPSGSPDTTPPSVPTGLAVTDTATTTVSLSWNASTDDVGVSGYKIYRDGVEVDDVATLTTTIGGLSPSTTYNFTVSAYDAATNESAQSSSVPGTTDALPPSDEVTRFTGSTLPAGWTATEPTGGTVVVENGYAALKSVAGSDFDSVSGGVTAPQGPRISFPVAGSFDFAVALAASPNTAPDQGVDLLALGSGTDAVRFAQYVGGTPGRSPSWFTYKRDSGSAANQSVTNPPTNLYGSWNWMRLTYDDVTDTFTCRASHTGTNDWHTISSFTSTIVPTSFVINATAFGPDANGREQRIAAVVDLAQRGTGDATIAPPAFERVTVLDADLSGAALPAGLTSSVSGGGTVVVSGGFARLTCDTSVVNSFAHIIGPNDLVTDHGLLMRYRFPQPNVQNAFGAPIIRGASSTTLPASQVLPDNYRPGTGALAEVNGGGSFGDIIRLLNAHPVELTETYAGGAEFDGFEMVIENLDSEVNGTLGNWIWIRIEAIDGTFRARFWNDGEAEPSTWYSATDFTQMHGTAVSLAWSHNDSTSGGPASMDVDHFEVYELVDPEPLGDRLFFDGTRWRNRTRLVFNGTDYI